MQVSTSTVEAPTAAEATATEQGVTDIYIGKGRFVKDDPKKYPAKDDLGPLIGASGACTIQYNTIQHITTQHGWSGSRTVVINPPCLHALHVCFTSCDQEPPARVQPHCSITLACNCVLLTAD